MKFILREVIMKQINDLSEINKKYLVDKQSFVKEYYNWLELTEKNLQRLRVPLVTLIQGEKIKLNSVLDGNVQNGYEKKNLRKHLKVASAQSFERISSYLYNEIEMLDKLFDEWSEKLTQAITVLACKDDRLFDNIAMGKYGESEIWKNLMNLNETVTICNYFSIKTSKSDIEYILKSIIENIKSNYKIN